ncbi:MAG: hypothetical protein Q4D62_11400 [Planctomycetia bacterium]|nr:hypothetical protein [Planctomycetia bacterium]
MSRPLQMGTNVNPNELQPSTGPEPGTYQVIATYAERVTADDGRYVKDDVELEVLAGSVIQQEGKKFRQSLFLRQNKQTGEWEETDQHLRWAYAAGLIQPGQTIQFDVRMFCGKTFVVSVEKDKNGRFMRVSGGGYDVWREDDPAVASVPKASLNSGAYPASRGDDLDAIFPK